MTPQVAFVVFMLLAAMLWIATKRVVAAHQEMQQRDILKHGITCEGRIVAIQRPFMLDNCTRLYFDFLPDGADAAVRGCHVDRRSADEPRTALPSQGSLVAVRYLPHLPRRAVIGKLVQ